MKIACTVGHSILASGLTTSADGSKLGGVNEYQWCKQFVPILVEVFNAQKGYEATLIQCPERKFTKASEEKTYKLSQINGKGYDLVIESHLNAFNGAAKGTETLYCKGSSKGKEIAKNVNAKLDDIFEGRYIKERDNLYILTQTEPVAILNEYFFCDNKEDYAKANTVEKMRQIALKVVEGVIGKTPINPFNQSNSTAANSNQSNSQKETYFRVIAGSFKERQYADKLLNDLRQKGYHPFIEVYHK